MNNAFQCLIAISLLLDSIGMSVLSQQAGLVHFIRYHVYLLRTCAAKGLTSEPQNGQLLAFMCAG